MIQKMIQDFLYQNKIEILSFLKENLVSKILQLKTFCLQREENFHDKTRVW